MFSHSGNAYVTGISAEFPTGQSVSAPEKRPAVSEFEGSICRVMLDTRRETDKIVSGQITKLVRDNRHQSISQSHHLYHVVLAHDILNGHSATEAQPIAVHG
jgi:hypothetical protein